MWSELAWTVGSVVVSVGAATAVLYCLSQWEVRSNLREARRQWETENTPTRDKSMAWQVQQVGGKWYYYNDQGYPSIGFRTEEEAADALSDYDATYYE